MPTPANLHESDDQRLNWYREAKFGLFIHWGAYAAAGAEASWPIMAPELSEAMFGTKTKISEHEYTALPARFNPVDFDPEQWVKAAKDAGMQYIVITTKHHDGFCMFDAPGTDYKITATAFGRDVCKELADACAKAGMRLGFYYSPPDMHHPGYRNMRKPAVKNWLGEPQRKKQWAEYLDYMESHIRKLLTDYGKVSIIWFDGLVNHAKYDPERFHKLVHELSPATLINDRLGDGYDYITPEQFIPKAGVPVKTHKPPNSNARDSESFFRIVTALFKVPGLRGWIRKQMEKYRDGSLELTPVIQTPYPSPEDFQPWETCMTMGNSWGYNPAETEWKAPGKLVRSLVQVVSRGGNYLLNVGPTDEGTFPPEAQERLQYIGRWMTNNSASIYGSTYTPLQEQTWGRVTRKDSTLYLHIFDYPANNKLVIADFPFLARSAKLLSGKSLAYKMGPNRLEVTLPANAPDNDVSVIAVEFVDTQSKLADHSPTKETRLTVWQYLKKQIIINFTANVIINGLLALGTYAGNPARVPYVSAAIDMLITGFIIGFLIAWIQVPSARNELFKGNIIKPAKKVFGAWMPRNAVLAGLWLGILITIFFAAVLTDGLMYLLAPNGFSNWAYIIFKAFFTGVAASITVILSVLSAVREAQRGNNR